MPRMLKKSGAPFVATRQRLIGRMADYDGQRKWQEFFESCWRLIYSVAMRAGLRDDEVQEVVQETRIGVARNVTSYDRKEGSFKAWLLHMARWRITDQFRKHGGERMIRRGDDTWKRPRSTACRVRGCGRSRPHGRMNGSGTFSIWRSGN